MLDLWADHSKYKAHIDSRIKLGHIKDESAYFNKTLAGISSAKSIALSGGKYPLMELAGENWSVVLDGSGRVKTSYQLDKGKKSFSTNQMDKGYTVHEQPIDTGIRKKLKGLFNLR